VIADSYTAARVPCVRYLGSHGFRVEEAADGDQALAVIKAVHPHVILMEATLPITPAEDLSRRLADDPRTRDIPLIVMTDDVAAQTHARVPHPPAGVLIKPFGLPAMLEEIRRVLRSRLSA
jgi:CheY-like chemotaxis protein